MRGKSLSFILAYLPGFEPGTYRVGVCHSIQLSYRYIFGFGASVDLQSRSLTLYPAELQVPAKFHYNTGRGNTQRQKWDIFVAAKGGSGLGEDRRGCAETSGAFGGQQQFLLAVARTI